MNQKILLCALVLAPLGLQGARADLSYSQKMSMGNVAINSAFKGKMRRVETSAFGQKTIVISQCGSKQVTRVAPSLKIYTNDAAATAKNRPIR